MTDIKLTSPNYSLNRNQKAFRINKQREPRSATDVRVSDTFKDDLLLAAKNLKESGYKIFIYLITNQHNFVGGLSMEDVTDKTGISESSYRRGVQELIDKGYLVNAQLKVTDKNNCSAPLYDFYARPDLYSN